MQRVYAELIATGLLSGEDLLCSVGGRRRYGLPRFIEIQPPTCDLGSGAGFDDGLPDFTVRVAFYHALIVENHRGHFHRIVGRP